MEKYCYTIGMFFKFGGFYTEAGSFALEQTLRDATLTVFSYVDFKVASVYYAGLGI
jgi:hypothetical protein